MSKRSIKAFKYWIPFAFVSTALSGLVYLAVQQDIRIGANDPQIQMSEDAAMVLSEGQPAQSVITTSRPIDISTSLSPFLIVYDNSGNPIVSSGELDHQTPKIPQGVLEYTKTNKQDRFTWQPKSGVRIAAVITRFDAHTQGFVLAGRNLREVEKRESQLEHQVAAAWVITLIGLLILAFVLLS